MRSRASAGRFTTGSEPRHSALGLSGTDGRKLGAECMGSVVFNLRGGIWLGDRFWETPPTSAPIPTPTTSAGNAAAPGPG